jgi:phosphohistidine phosphatase
MELFVLRHGQAEPYCADDASRELVARGRADVAQVVQDSLADLPGVNQLWVSPFIRAQQTAQIAAQILGNPPFLSTSLLIPEADPACVIEALQAADVQSLLVVSHQPFVSRFIEILCAAPPGAYGMDTSSLACIDLRYPAAGLGSLRWLRHRSA